MMKRMFLATIVTVLLLLYSPAFAGIGDVYWVSPTGAETTWSNCKSVTPLSGSACCTVSTAFANATEGEEINFRGGNYDAGSYSGYSTGVYNPAHAGTAANRIVFKAYTGETPVFTGVGRVDYGYITLFGSNAYVTYDGFVFGDTNYGGRIVVGEYNDGSQYPGIIVKNCTFIGVTTTLTDNREAIRLSAPGAIIQYCTFLGWKDTADNHNASAIKAYWSRDYVIEYCEFSGSTVGMYEKSTNHLTQNQNAIIRYNWFHDNSGTDLWVEDSGSRYADGMRVYGNLFTGGDGAAINMAFTATTETVWTQYSGNIYSTAVAFDPRRAFYNGTQLTPNDGNYASLSPNEYDWDNGTMYVNVGEDPDNNGGVKCYTLGSDIQIYNNTIYKSGSGYPIWIKRAIGTKIFDNIVFRTSAANSLAVGEFVEVDYDLTQCDHNQWGTASFSIRTKVDGGNDSYSSLSAWQSSGELHAAYDAGCGNHNNPGCGSLVSDPQFLNSSGNLNQIADFEPQASATLTGGRGGGPMGADVSLVGTGATPSSDTTPPSVSNQSPVDQLSGVSKSTNISANISDAGSGVDQSTIVMTVEGSPVTPTITGSSVNYTVTYDPQSDFSYEQVVNITLDADDLGGNSMTQVAWSFTIESQPSLSCGDLASLCISEAECSSNWPAYNWCGSGCQQSPCSAAYRGAISQQSSYGMGLQISIFGPH